MLFHITSKPWTSRHYKGDQKWKNYKNYTLFYIASREIVNRNLKHMEKKWKINQNTKLRFPT